MTPNYIRKHNCNRLFASGKPELTTAKIQGVNMAGLDTVAKLVKYYGVVTIRNAADMGNLGQTAYFSQEFINAISTSSLGSPKRNDASLVK